MILRGLAGVIIILLINFIAGCYYYKVSTSYQPPAEELVKMSDLDKKFVVHNFMVDKYGVGHIISKPFAPVSATSLMGEEVLPLIEKEDDLVYLGNDPSRDPPLLDGIELTYNIPPGIKTVDLVISAKNSYWLDFVYQNFREMLGASYKMWMKRQQDGDPQQMESWSLSQNIPLSVYLFKDGEWVFHDYYNTVGPMAFKKDILELDLSGMEKGPLRIKLEAGSYFNELMQEMLAEHIWAYEKEQN